MQVVAAIKIVPDDQDIQVAADRSLDFSKARPVVSEYDLNALEAAVQLAAATGGSAIAVTAGAASIDDSKTKKNVLARGMEALYLTADDACADMDAYATAQVLAPMVEDLDGWDVVLVGDGSADLYAKQTGAQLAARLNVPYVAGAIALEEDGGSLKVRRKTEDEVEVLSVPLPAVVSVLPEAAAPRIPGMKDILAAGKKPMNVAGASDVAAAAIEVVDCKAPEQADRKLEIFDASEDGAIDSFVAAIKAAL